MNKLPNKPSALIRLALADLALCKADPEYALDMSNWHYYNTYYSGLCYVCFAGSVMAKTLKVNRLKRFNPSLFIHSIEYKLSSLEFFRNGDVDSGLEYFFDFRRNFNLTGFKPPRWRKTEQGYSPAYLGRLADEFERCGL